jgi:hypothetical protein
LAALLCEKLQNCHNLPFAAKIGDLPRNTKEERAKTAYPVEKKKHSPKKSGEKSDKEKASRGSLSITMALSGRGIQKSYSGRACSRYRAQGKFNTLFLQVLERQFPSEIFSFPSQKSCPCSRSGSAKGKIFRFHVFIIFNKSFKANREKLLVVVNF